MRRRTFLGAGAALAGWSAAAPAIAAELPALIATAKPSVLPVGTWSATDSPRFGFRGTGFVVGDGTLLVTCFHVLPAGADTENGPRMAVLLPRPGAPESAMRMARVLATDRFRDLALLRLEGAPLPALGLADPASAREGQSVLLMGYPIGGVLGFATVSHRGIVASITPAVLPATHASQLDPRAIAQMRNGNFELLQLDATAYPGNSGGPVMDAETGRVVGVLAKGLVKAGRESALTDPTGITYAVPVQFVHELMKQPR